jgi:hypothetical protein
LIAEVKWSMNRRAEGFSMEALPSSFLHRMLFMESRLFLKIVLRRGAATAHIAVTKPVVISTTKTQPGTSPRSLTR